MSTRLRNDAAVRQGDPAARNRVREDLARLGVHGEAGEALASRLAPLAPRLSADAYDAALAGAALAHGLARDGERIHKRNLRDLQEIQRLLAGFADELQKVDEALRILSVYVTRMRKRAAPHDSGTVH